MQLRYDKMWVEHPHDAYGRFNTIQKLSKDPLGKEYWATLCKVQSGLLHTCSANGLFHLSVHLGRSFDADSTKEHWKALFEFLAKQSHRTAPISVRPAWEMHKFFFFLEYNSLTKSILEWVPELTLEKQFTNRGAGGPNPTCLISFEV